MAKFCTGCGVPLNNEEQVCTNCSGGKAPSLTFEQTPPSSEHRRSSPSSAYKPPPLFSGQNAVADASSFLKNFLLPLKNKMGIGEPENDAPGGIYERGMLITPDSIEPTEGEIPVKQYDVAVLRTRSKLMRAEGRMQVTNKRLLFRAAGLSVRGKTTLQHEFEIDSIAGIEAHKGFKISFFNLFFGSVLLIIFAVIFGALVIKIGAEARSVTMVRVIGILFGIAGAIPIFIFHKKFWIKLMPAGVCAGGIIAAWLFGNVFRVYGASIFGQLLTPMGFLVILAVIIAGASLFFVAVIPDLIINIKTKAGQSGTGSIQIGRKKWNKMENTGYRDVFPTVETEGAIREIGAIINDIQKLGDFGINKWKQ